MTGSHIIPFGARTVCRLNDEPKPAAVALHEFNGIGGSYVLENDAHAGYRDSSEVSVSSMKTRSRSKTSTSADVASP
jgi:hypothetical protein